MSHHTIKSVDFDLPGGLTINDFERGILVKLEV